MAILSPATTGRSQTVRAWTGPAAVRSLLAALLGACALPPSRAADPPSVAGHFAAIEDFSGFTRTLTTDGTVVLLSPVIATPLEWDELVVSWNARLSPTVALRVEARAGDDDRPTRFYGLGIWSLEDPAQVRRSLGDQKDDDGEVQTDVLVLKRPARRVQVRLTLEGLCDPARHRPVNRKPGHASRRPGPDEASGRSELGPAEQPSPGEGVATPALLRRLRPRRGKVREQPSELAFLGLSFLNTRATAASDPPSNVEPVAPLPVPERSQLAHEAGGAWCSPTAVSMILGYWAERCGRPDWDRAVPEVAAGVSDPSWPGTGNWPFNTAYAGALPGMRGYVTRLGSLSELGAWLQSGVPVAASVSYSVLQGQPHNGNGHLVVCVGLTAAGDVIVNDPGTRHEIRRTFSQTDFLRAWAHSHHTVYLIHPRHWRVPTSPPR